MIGLLLLALLQGYVAGQELLTPEPPHSVDGLFPNTADYPWIVAVYKAEANDKTKFHFICSGSLVGVDVALSVAHCFWHDGNKIPFDQYKISAGNYYRDIEHNETKQVFQVKDVTIHNRYADLQRNYAYDIAIVWLEGRLDVSTNMVRPIAIDWNRAFDDLDLTLQLGIVVGWGFTDDNETSEKRVAVQLPYIDFDSCRVAVPLRFRPYITADKFCAGHRNGTTVCTGASGGGLAFKDPTTKNWYLRGIMSIAERRTGADRCYKVQYFGFTSIASNLLWLNGELNEKRRTVNG